MIVRSIPPAKGWNENSQRGALDPIEVSMLIVALLL